MKIMFFVTFLGMVTLFSTSYEACAAGAVGVPKTNLLEELTQTFTEEEIKTLDAHEMLSKMKDVPGAPWPEITYYMIVEATPLEAAGLFAAYDIQKDYIPNVLKSTPVKHLSATEVLTDYELHIPFPLSNARYTHGAKIYKMENDYAVEWYMTESTSTDEVHGSAYFTPYKNNSTLFRYRNYVKPKSSFASLVKKKMFTDVRDSVLAIRNFIEKCKREKSPLLGKYSEFITRALRGEFVYQTIIDKK